MKSHILRKGRFNDGTLGRAFEGLEERQGRLGDPTLMGSPNLLLSCFRFLSPPGIQGLYHLGQGQHVSVFLVHIEQVDGMSRFVAVESAFLYYDHAEAICAPLDYAGA